MGKTLCLVFCFHVLCLTWIVGGARTLDMSEVTVVQINHDITEAETEVTEFHLRNEKLCAFCQEFTAKALDFLKQNKTETEIISDLRKACSNLHSLQQKCLLLVDYYAPLFFKELAFIKPDKFCEKVNLCEGIQLFSSMKGEGACATCHEAVVEILIKLKDPDAQLDIVEAILKVCNSLEKFKQQCKKVVFEFIPIILVNAEKFLETTDVCTAVHVCKANQQELFLKAFPTEKTVVDA